MKSMNIFHKFFCFACLALVAFLSADTRAAYPFGDELIRYQFEGSATATSTNSGTGGTSYDGTFVGAASTTAVQKLFGSKSAVFNDTNDYMRTYYGNGINPTTQSISVSLWVYKGGNTCNSGDDDHIFGVGHSSNNQRFYIRCRTSTTNKWGYRIQANAEVFSTNSVSTTGWDHIVLVANAATDQASFYVNGVAIGSPAAYTSFVLPADFYVGNFNDAQSGTLLEGAGAYMDEVAIYNRALSLSEVQDIYQTGQPAGQISGLTATGYESKAYLSWTAGSGTTTDYVIEYKLTSEPTTWTTFSDGVSTTTNVIVTGLTNGLSYDFRITPKNGEVLGTVSSTVTTTPIQRVVFVSPTPTNGSTIVGTSVTVYASSTMPSTSAGSSTQIIRLETAGGSLVSQVSTTTRYGDYNLTHLTNTLANSDLSLAGNSSGIVHVPTTDTLFIVHNATVGTDATIDEVDKNGALIRSITCTTCGDIESITLVSSTASSTTGGYDHTFLVGTENNTSQGEFFRIIVPSSGSFTTSRATIYNTGVSHASNGGFEGIAYNSSTGVVYLAKELSSPALYEVVPGSSATPICTNLTWNAGITDFSDLAYNNGILYVLSENTNPSKLVAINITSTSTCSYVDSDGDGDSSSGDTGDWLSSLLVGGTDQAEGVAWDATGDTLWVLGEADFLAKYRTNVFNTRHTFTGLSNGDYVLKSSFIDANGVVSSSTDRAFTVAAPTSATVTVGTTTSVSTSSAVLNGTLVDDGYASTTSWGFEYGTTSAFGTIVTVGGWIPSGTPFSVTITGLEPSTLYHVRAFVTTTYGTASSTDFPFVTEIVTAPLPVVIPAVQNTPIIGPIGGSSSGNGAGGFGQQQPQQQNNPQPNTPVAAFKKLGNAGVVIKNIQAPGRRNLDVKNIQKILNADKATQIAKKGPGSPGKETNLYGAATRAAVQKFQLKYGIVKSPKDKGYGIVGPATRKKMNELLGKK